MLEDVLNDSPLSIHLPCLTENKFNHHITHSAFFSIHFRSLHTENFQEGYLFKKTINVFIPHNEKSK